MNTTPALYVTTSWDDGHPLDLRVAELLHKYKLSGTFYVPRLSQRPTLSEAQVRHLASEFEIGAHTLHHVDVTSVALLSTHFPVQTHGIMEMPTTIHAHSHSIAGYVRNLAKRRAFGGMWKYLLAGRGRNWPDVARWIWTDASEHDGVFHLWGHSWEIEEYGQWQQLEDFFRFLSQHTAEDHFRTNGEICAHRPTGMASAFEPRQAITEEPALAAAMSSRKHRP